MLSTYFAGQGFAYGGGLPLAAAVGLGVGAALVMFPGRGAAAGPAVVEGGAALEEAA